MIRRRGSASLQSAGARAVSDVQKIIDGWQVQLVAVRERMREDIERPAAVDVHGRQKAVSEVESAYRPVLDYITDQIVKLEAMSAPRLTVSACRALESEK